MAFVDVRMPPGWDGLETIGHLWRAQPDLQVVICTAYSDFSWDDIRRRLGQVDNLLILKKPFDNVEVLQLVHALTGQWTLAQQARLRLADLEAHLRTRTAELERTPVQLLPELSERPQREDALRQAQKIEAMGQLTSGVAHDFNNLLTIIQGHASLRLDSPPSDEKVADSLKEISRAAERAAALTRQLLAFGRKQLLPGTSTEGQTSWFRAFPPEGRCPPSITPEPGLVLKRAGPAETVLVVEDERTLRELLRLMLERQGYCVLEAADGAAGLQVWRENQGRVDLLLSDMVMPGGMSGLQLAEELRRHAPDLKVLFSSGYSQDLFSSGLRRMQRAGFLPKPYRPQELGRTVRACLDGESNASLLQP
jgi:CheY-like chemotaxis protein